jgi:hypothetical protein
MRLFKKQVELDWGLVSICLIKCLDILLIIYMIKHFLIMMYSQQNTLKLYFLLFIFQLRKQIAILHIVNLIPNKKNMKHVDFRKRLANSIFGYYSNEEVIADRTKKKKTEPKCH